MGRKPSTLAVDLSTKGLPKRLRHKTAIERAEMYAARRLPQYLKKLEELALGEVLVAKKDRDGNDTIYRLPPNIDALKYLTDRGMGKLPSRIEVTGEEGGPLEVLAWAPASALREDPNTIEGEVVGKEDQEAQG